MNQCPECGSDDIEHDSGGQHITCFCRCCEAEWRCASRGVLNNFDLYPSEVLEDSYGEEDIENLETVRMFV